MRQTDVSPALLRHVVQARAERSLYAFVRLMWRAVEPATEFVPGRALEAICEHLEAVEAGDLRRLIINVSPGFSKSLVTNVFFPAWLWGPRRKPHLRFLSTSYSAQLTERDNDRCMRVVLSPLYQQMWGDVVTIEKTGVTKIGTNHTGWKLATSVGGVATGERADFVLIDDPNDIRTAESATVRNATNMWLREVMPTRLNSPAKSAIICIQQRTHEEDATGTLLGIDGSYCHLMIPMHYDPERHCETEIGWSDWRTEPGELAWPERYPAHTVAEMERAMGPYAASGQFEQAPVPRGGAIIQREWWQEWLPRESPPVEFVLASLDTAVKEKEESDYYALTVWAVWRDPDTSTPRLLMLNAWRQRAALHVICQRVVRTCRQLRVDRLLIEDKANGWVCQQEIVRLTGGSRFGISMFDPRRYGDKMARLLSVQHLFAEGLVYAPAVEDADGNVSFRQWAQDVIDEVSLFPRAAHDDFCLVGDTLVLMADGAEKSIRLVEVGDLVDTPYGPRRVIEAGFTGVKPTWRLEHKLGRLEGTGNHPVSVDDDWIPIECLRPSNHISVVPVRRYGWQPRDNRTLGAKWSCLKATVTDVIQTALGRLIGDISHDLGSCFIGPYGSTTTAPFRMASTSTTSTKSRQTIASKTSNACPGECIEPSPMRRGMPILPVLSSLRDWVVLRRRRSSGINQRPVGHGIGSTYSSRFISRVRLLLFGASRAVGHVSGAVESSHTNPSVPYSARGSVRGPTRNTSEVFSVEPTRTMRPVFNLTVEGAHCYYANGILVHNCDSLSQAIRHLRDIGFALRKEEHSRAEASLMKMPENRRPLYPV